MAPVGSEETPGRQPGVSRVIDEPRGVAPGSVYSDRHAIGVSYVLPRDVNPSAGNVAVRKRACVIPASPRQSAPRRLHYSRRFGLGIAYERH